MDTATTTPSCPPLEYYRLVRERLEHEDELIVQRLSWLVASQSFLFTAYAVTLNGLQGPRGGVFADQLMHLYRLIPAVGVLSCSLIYTGIIAAVIAVHLLRRAFDARIKDEASLGVPPIQTARPLRLLGQAAPLSLPLLFIIVGLFLLTRGLVGN